MHSAAGHGHLLAMACELGAHLTCHLKLLQEPLQHLPLAVWQEEGSSGDVFAFPSSTGLWVVGQKATEACVFLMSHLLMPHKGLLTSCQLKALKTSMPFLQSVLRCLKPTLPRKDDLLRAHSRVAHTRLALRDGWIDTGTMEFHTLPFNAEHMVFRPALPFCYATELAAVSQADMEAAHAMLAAYIPVQEERQWLLAFLGRCLCPLTGSKAVLVLTDSLGVAQGNAGKSSLLAWIHACMGTNSCVLKSGQVLTNACTFKTKSSSQPQVPDSPLIRLFDELSRCAGKAQAQQLNYGAIKYKSSGRRQQPATIISANLSDLPDLTQVKGQDPSFVNRLVLLPARGRFANTDIFDSHCLDSLSPALAKILLGAFHDYKRGGDKLPPMPTSMHHFKELVVRASALSSMPSTDAIWTKTWVQRNLIYDNTSQGAVLPARLLTDMFLLQWSGHDGGGRTTKHNRCKAHILLDAAQAELGIHANEDGLEYLHVAWSNSFGVYL